jgi:hypothetical protein
MAILTLPKIDLLQAEVRALRQNLAEEVIHLVVKNDPNYENLK